MVELVWNQTETVMGKASSTGACAARTASLTPSRATPAPRRPVVDLNDNLEPLENHTVLVDADTEDDAIARIRTALEPHDGFGDFSAHESGAP